MGRGPSRGRVRGARRHGPGAIAWPSARGSEIWAGGRRVARVRGARRHGPGPSRGPSARGEGCLGRRTGAAKMGPARRRYLPIDRARQRQSAGCCSVALGGHRDVGGTALPARARRGPPRLRPISAALVLRASIVGAPLERPAASAWRSHRVHANEVTEIRGGPTAVSSGHRSVIAALAGREFRARRRYQGMRSPDTTSCEARPPSSSSSVCSHCAQRRRVLLERGADDARTEDEGR